MTVLANSLLNQYLRALDMTKDAVEMVPDSRWHDGPEKWFYSLTTYHIVETIEFYLRDDHEGMVWGERAGYSWSEDIKIKDEILPKITKTMVLSYVSEVEEALHQFFSNISDDALLQKDRFHWFSCVLEKLQYALRHSAHHCGELSVMLRNWGVPHFKWK
ncbi:MAG: DinB family protein [Candidatus Thorarchaeota archaeon]